jgi:heme exporter protein D
MADTGSAILEFLSMGGHAAFIWPAYGVTALVMVALVAVSRRTLRANETAVREMESARPRRARRNAEAPADDA